MSDPLEDRLSRIYAAFGETVDHDLSPYRAVESRPAENVFVIGMYFNQGMTKDQLHNAAHSVIHNVAHLKDHFKKYLRSRGESGQTAEDTVDASLELKLITDLSNNDKHGYPPRDGGKTGFSPRLVELRRSLLLKAPPNRSIQFAMPLNGAPPTITGGRAPVVVTGVIVNKDGKHVADLHTTLERAIAVWESVLRRHGIAV